MTDYLKIQPTEISVDAPITVQLFDKLRKNPLAIQEGSTGGDDTPRYEQESCEESTATAQSKDRLVAFRMAIRTTSLGTPSANIETADIRVARSGVYGLHVYNSYSSGNVNCGIYIDGGLGTTITVTNYWSLITLQKGQQLKLRINSTGNVHTNTFMYLYTNNPMGDMQLMGGYRASKLLFQGETNNEQYAIAVQRDTY
tara:strand:+ start:1638 stop:2234 length:597 start_codon:yes stop_codon:yes gene_type:complete